METCKNLIKSLAINNMILVNIIYLSISFNVNGQGVIEPNSGNQGTHYKHFNTNSPNLYKISVPEGATFSPTWSWMYYDNSRNEWQEVSTTEVLVNGIKVKRNVNTVEVKNTASSLPHTDTLKLMIDKDTSSIIPSKEFVFFFRHPLQLVFVLDRSGSMECPAIENSVSEWPECISSTFPLNCKWDDLKNAISNFIAKIDPENFLIDQDRFSADFFSGTVYSDATLPMLNGFRTLSEFNAEIQSVYNVVSSPHLGRNGTSIGAGMASAIGKLSAVNGRELILLITDGEQNTEPMIQINGPNPGNWQINTTSNNTPSSGTEIYAIGFDIGHLNGTNNLIQLISSNGGAYYPDTDLAPTLSDAFNEIFHHYSPNVIKSVNEDVLSEYNELNFKCNKYVSRIFFEAHHSNPVAGSFKYIIEKNGENVTDFAQKIHFTNKSALYIIDFQKLTEISSEGDWTFRHIRNDGFAPLEANHKVKLVATADDHFIDFDAKVENRFLKVGDKVEMSIRLKAGKEIINNASAKVTIISSKDNIGNILATAENPVLSNNTELGGYANQKYLDLQINNPSALKGFIDKKQQDIELIKQKDGTFTGLSDIIDVEGILKIIFHIQADINEVGRVERMKEQTVNVKYGTINHNLSVRDNRIQIIPTTLKLPSKGIITVRPAYKFNNKKYFIGPGYTNAISLTGENIKTSEVTDNGDGSYNVVFDLANELNPEIQLNLLGEEIYSGKLKKFDNWLWPKWLELLRNILIILLLIFVVMYLVMKKL